MSPARHPLNQIAAGMFAAAIILGSLALFWLPAVLGQIAKGLPQ